MNAKFTVKRREETDVNVRSEDADGKPINKSKAIVNVQLRGDSGVISLTGLSPADATDFAKDATFTVSFSKD